MTPTSEPKAELLGNELRISRERAVDGKFDIYAEWLNIPAGPRPPDYFTLLGVSAGERDAAVIERAALERMKAVRPRCLKFPEEGTNLLNEISAARVCLVDPASRDEYEKALARASLPEEVQLKIEAERDDYSLAAYENVRELPWLAELATGEFPGEGPVGKSAERPSSAAGSRFCPHCGRRLLPAETSCVECSAAAVGHSETWLAADVMNCRSCGKRMPPGHVKCDRCGNDHALSTRPKMPSGVKRHTPFFAWRVAGRQPAASLEADPLIAGRPTAKPKPREATGALASRSRDSAGDSATRRLWIFVSFACFVALVAAGLAANVVWSTRQQRSNSEVDSTKSASGTAEIVAATATRDDRVTVSGAGPVAAPSLTVSASDALPHEITGEVADDAGFVPKGVSAVPGSAHPGVADDMRGDAYVIRDALNEALRAVSNPNSAIAWLESLKKRLDELGSRHPENAEIPLAVQRLALVIEISQARTTRDRAARTGQSEALYRRLTGPEGLRLLRPPLHETYCRALEESWFAGLVNEATTRIHDLARKNDFRAAKRVIGTSLPPALLSRNSAWIAALSDAVNTDYEAYLERIFVEISGRMKQHKHLDAYERAKSLESEANGISPTAGNLVRDKIRDVLDSAVANWDRLDARQKTKLLAVMATVPAYQQFASTHRSPAPVQADAPARRPVPTQAENPARRPTPTQADVPARRPSAAEADAPARRSTAKRRSRQDFARELEDARDALESPELQERFDYYHDSIKGLYKRPDGVFLIELDRQTYICDGLAAAVLKVVEHEQQRTGNPRVRRQPRLGMVMNNVPQYTLIKDQNVKWFPTRVKAEVFLDKIRAD